MDSRELTKGRVALASSPMPLLRGGSEPCCRCDGTLACRVKAPFIAKLRTPGVRPQLSRLNVLSLAECQRVVVTLPFVQGCGNINVHCYQALEESSSFGHAGQACQIGTETQMSSRQGLPFHVHGAWIFKFR
jgi:hypothetical protein